MKIMGFNYNARPRGPLLDHRRKLRLKQPRAPPEDRCIAVAKQPYPPLRVLRGGTGTEPKERASSRLSAFMRPRYFAFLNAAHRLFVASAIALRPAALNRRFLRTAVLADDWRR
jgi:hypothetical protein